MKKILLIITLGMFSLSLFTGNVMAEVSRSVEPLASIKPSASPLLKMTKELKSPIGQVTAISNLIQRADNEITRRVTSLTELITRINELKKLSATEKTTLTTGIQAEITSLNTLKTKIDQDTDLATLKTDVKSVVEDYRVYALYIPQIRIISAADSSLTASENLTILATKFNSLIISSGATGATLTSLQNYLSDMKTKISAANTSALAAQNEVVVLTPQGYPANKTALDDARAKIKIAIKDLQTARDDAKQIVKILRGLNKPLNATSSGKLEK
jgi:predicted  nucleic acid-binding Zn-ribbon protein